MEDRGRGPKDFSNPQPPSSIPRVLPAGKLIEKLKGIRRGKTLVFTNGCFDVLHTGHLRVLRWAKKQGDTLIVGLNSDRSVRRLKGSARPLLPLRERAAMLAALKPVDYVTSFDDDTPESLIRRLRPDVLVKGGDWPTDRIAGRHYVRRVVRVPFLKGRSTSGLIELILRRYGRR